MWSSSLVDFLWSKIELWVCHEVQFESEASHGQSFEFNSWPYGFKRYASLVSNQLWLRRIDIASLTHVRNLISRCCWSSVACFSKQSIASLWRLGGTITDGISIWFARSGNDVVAFDEGVTFEFILCFIVLHAHLNQVDILVQVACRYLILAQTLCEVFLQTALIWVNGLQL